MKTQEQIIRSGRVANYDEFLTENRKAINKQFAVIMRVLLIVSPLLAIMVKLRLFMGVTLGSVIFITIYILALTVINEILLRRRADSFLTSLIVLLAMEGLLLVINSTHLTIYIAWFLVPLMALLFCHYR